MGKELEALEVSKQLKEFVLEFIKNGLDRRFIHGSFDIIETALKKTNELILENQGLKNANRDLLEEKQTLLETLGQERQNAFEEYLLKDTIIKQNQKKLKAFEIIKEKPYGITHIRTYKTYEEYMQSCFRQYNPLTKEEFDLLKEVLL